MTLHAANHELEVTARQATQLEWRLSPAGYGERLTRNRTGPQRFLRPPHVEHVSRHLAEVVAGRCDRLIITLPPQHSKSSCLAWTVVQLLDLHPHLRILWGSYADKYAAEWGALIRGHIERNQEHLRVRLERGFQSKAVWRTTAGGGLVTSGRNGQFTGRPGDVVIIDDLFKDARDADSKANRDAAWSFYTSAAYTRLGPGLHPNGVVVMANTRWSADDHIGRVKKDQEAGGDQFTEVRLPAFAEEGDPLGRPLGEALWPEVRPAEFLLKQRRLLGSWLFAALFQQRPVPLEGGIFKGHWWRYWRERPATNRYDEVISVWDMAFKDNDDSSYVVGQVWGRIGADRYLLDQVRDHMDFPETIKAVMRLSEKWPEARLKLIEDKANGPAVIQVLRHSVPGLVPVPVFGSKTARAVAASADAESGNVYLPDESYAPWIVGWVSELADFPKGEHDDQVDTFAMAMAHFAKRADGGMGDTYDDQRLAGRR